MYHTNNRTIQGQALININGETISYSENTNIIGVIFDQKLSMKHHIDQRIQMANFTLSRLKNLKNPDKTTIHVI